MINVANLSEEVVAKVTAAGKAVGKLTSTTKVTGEGQRVEFTSYFVYVPVADKFIVAIDELVDDDDDCDVCRFSTEGDMTSKLFDTIDEAIEWWHSAYEQSIDDISDITCTGKYYCKGTNMTTKGLKLGSDTNGYPALMEYEGLDQYFEDYYDWYDIRDDVIVVGRQKLVAYEDYE